MKLLEAINAWTKWKMLMVKKNTIYGYDGHLRHFCVFLHNEDIENITLEQVVEYLALCQKVGYRGLTLQKYGLAIKEMLDFYYKQRYRVLDPALVVIPNPEDYRMPRVATNEDFAKLIKSIPYSNAYYHLRNRAIIWLLHDSGARVSEIGSLFVKDIDLGKMEAIIKAEKNRTDTPFRKIFWNKECNEALMDLSVKRAELLKKIELPEEDKDYLFISVNGGAGRMARRMDIQAIGEALRKYSNRAGLKYVLNPHSFRHRMGHELAKRGVNNSLISQFMGHKTLEASRIYTTLSGFELGRIYHKIIKR